MAVGSTLLAWVMLGGHYTLYLMYHTLFRDLKTAWRVGHLLYINIKAKRNDMSVGDKFQVKYKLTHLLPGVRFVLHLLPTRHPFALH